jgi:hypothetical protein
MKTFQKLLSIALMGLSLSLSANHPENPTGLTAEDWSRMQIKESVVTQLQTADEIPDHLLNQCLVMRLQVDETGHLQVLEAQGCDERVEQWAVAKLNGLDLSSVSYHGELYLRVRFQ